MYCPTEYSNSIDKLCFEIYLQESIMMNKFPFYLVLLSVLLMYSCKPITDKEEKQSSTEKRVSIAEIEEGIKSYIKKKSEAADGYFHARDENKELRLKLVRVHTEYLSNLGPNHHFACVDLADENGDVYDVDFFLEGKPGNMKVTETSVHKLNGKPFYSWKQKENKTWGKVPVESAGKELLGVIEGEDQFIFHYQISLPEINEQARMWIPIAKSDSFQTVDLVSFQSQGTFKELKESEHGNTIMYFELNREDSEKEILLSYKVLRKEKGAYVDADSDPVKYLQANALLPLGGRFAEIAAEALAGKEEESQLMKARALYDYIIDNMRYAKDGNHGTGDAVYACDSKSGNCTEFHSFFISLARTAGIPARFAIGAAIPSDRNEGGIDGYHCWAEFYAEGKWWPVDISEGNKYTTLATYYFGRHPANRVELSRGRDLLVKPGPVSGAINFLAYPILEVDGQRQSAKTMFSFER